MTLSFTAFLFNIGLDILSESSVGPDPFRRWLNYSVDPVRRTFV